MNPLNHVAIIMDGNGRWGLKHKNSRNAGHKAGLIVVEKIIEEVIRNKIKYLTLFAFSTENWRRPKKEIKYIFDLLEVYLKTKLVYLNKHKIKFKVIGSRNFSNKLKKLVKTSEQQTKKNSTLQLNLALDYGSKNELLEAFRKIKISKKKINFLNFENYLQTAGIPDPDILIRTGNRNRLSNFLLWQLAYTEIFFKKKLWPDFNAKDFYNIITKYKKIKRNYGKI